MFCSEGGVDIGNVDEKAARMRILTGEIVNCEQIKNQLIPKSLNSKARDSISEFILDLFSVFVDLNFTYLEINPLVYSQDQDTIHVLDLAAKLDQTAEFESGKSWNAALKLNEQDPITIDFPAPFGRDLTREEKYVAELDSKTGASLKLTILNKDGRIWTMVAGGGASVAYR